jgi:hypothetical protein
LQTGITEEVTTRPERSFAAGADDIVIVPLAAAWFAVRALLRWLLRLLIRLLDYAFPILLQIARFPLFTLRILGDALAALARGVIALLPVGSDRRSAWRQKVSEAWAWLRARISYKAFEEWLHHLFEDGMAWVFRTCRRMTPRVALVVLVGAVIWLPLSFVIATGMHAILFAKATVWPAWLQLLHPVATVIAKSKLLVLPVYPAAWPQAKLHPLVQALIAFARYVAALRIVRKTVYRYRQTAYAARLASRAFARSAERAGADRLARWIVATSNTLAAGIGGTLRRMAAGAFEVASNAPLIGHVMRRYAAHYEAVPATPTEKFSMRVSDFFARWSVKLSADYYEAKERAEAATAAAASHEPAGAATR